MMLGHFRAIFNRLHSRFHTSRELEASSQPDIRVTCSLLFFILLSKTYWSFSQTCRQLWGLANLENINSAENYLNRKFSKLSMMGISLEQVLGNNSK